MGINKLYGKALISLFIGLFFFQIVQAQDSRATLFSIANKATSEWSGKQAGDLQRVEIQIDDQTLQKIAGKEIDEFDIVNFSGEIFQVTVRRVIEQPLGDWSITGMINGKKEDSFTLSYSDGKVIALTRLISEHYFSEIRFNDFINSHMMVELNLHDLEDLSCGMDHQVDKTFDNDLEKSKESQGFSFSQGRAVIDVLIVYTEAARIWANNNGGIDNIVIQSMALAQNAVDNSLVNLELRLAHHEEIIYTEGNDINEDLTNLRNDNIEGVHDLRVQYKADLVALFSDQPTSGAVGTAYMPNNSFPFDPVRGFSVSTIRQVSTTLVHAHEMGHNLGNGHEPESTTPDRFNDFAQAHRWNDLSQVYESVMWSNITPAQIDYFSNPDVSYRGEATGSINSDNASNMSETKHYVANYSEQLVQTYSISGQVVGENGAAISGMSMLLVRHNQSSNITATTDGGGVYTFSDLPAGQDYTVAPQSFDDFDPSSTRFDNLSNNQTQNFQRLVPTYTITTSENNSEWGTTSGGGTYEEGQTVEVIATPSTGYDFVLWGEAGVEVSTEARYSFTAGGDRELVAEFKAEPVVLTVSTTNLDFEFPAGTKSFAVISNTTWNVSDDRDWISVSGVSGSGDDSEVSVNVEANSSITERTGTVTVSGGGLSRDISITQSPYALEAPVIVSPVDEAINVSLNTTFDWEPVVGAERYELHFNTVDPIDTIIEATFSGSEYTHFEPLLAGRIYDWRVRAIQGEMVGEWSPIQRFTTIGAPGIVQLESPSNGANDVDYNVTIRWQAEEFVTRYKVEVSTDDSFNSDYLIYDNSAVKNSNVNLEQLDPETIYYWRVRAFNEQTGYVDWSDTWSFTTKPTVVSVLDPSGTPRFFSLSQNYPNPFNPSTQISYTVPSQRRIKLEIFTMLGERIAILVDEVKNPGNYSTSFDASNLSSGTYLYRLQAGDYVQTEKMILIK